MSFVFHKYFTKSQSKLQESYEFFTDSGPDDSMNGRNQKCSFKLKLSTACSNWSEPRKAPELKELLCSAQSRAANELN